MKQKNAATLLKNVSVIMIVAGVLDIVFGLLPLLFGSFMQEAIVTGATASTANESTIYALAGFGLMKVLGVALLVAGVFHLLAGVAGGKAARGEGDLKTARIFAVITLVCAIISVVLEVLAAIGTPGLLMKSVSALVSLTVPILFIIGVKQAEETE